MRAEHLSIGTTEDEFEMHWLRAGVVGHVLIRMEVNTFEICDACAPQRLLSRTSKGHGEAKETADGRSLSSMKAGRASANSIGCDSALAVCRPGKRNNFPGTGCGIPDFDRIADR